MKAAPALLALVGVACLASTYGPERGPGSPLPGAPPPDGLAASAPDRTQPAQSWAAWAGLPPCPPCLAEPVAAPVDPPAPTPAPAAGWLDFVAAAGGVATGNPLVWSLAGQLGHLLYGVASRRRAAHKGTPS